MSLRLEKMFDPRNSHQHGPVGSDRWNSVVFRRAYCDPAGQTGPFDKVVARLRDGFSVLIYLPGNCMAAAAEAVQKMLPDNVWQSCGVHPGDDGDPMAAWRPAGSIVGNMLNWLKSHEGDAPHAVFHNLDLLRDNYGGVLSSDVAHSAVFSMIEATRRGVVLGLSDREAGELPGPMHNAFTDHVWLRTIDDSSFRRIVPVQLGEILSADGRTVPEGPVQQIAARLRWSDPIRAVRIMDSVADLVHDRQLAEVLDEIRRCTCPPGYASPEEMFRDVSTELSGFDQERTLSQLNSQIIQPYRSWTGLQTENVELWQRETRKLRQGVILFGPAGTGKTTLAKYLAHCIGLPIRVVTAAEIRKPTYGDAERAMRSLFTEARRASPCVLVLDDCDDLFPDRSSIDGSTASADLGVVNTALQELEGVNGPLTGVLLVMTTNRFHKLDDAIRQRLSLHIKVPYPIHAQQVGEIIDAGADMYGFELQSDIRDALVKEFLQPVDVNNRLGRNQPSVEPADRRRCTEGLFAPRMILRDMLLLRNDEDMTPGESYRVTTGDLERMKQYHVEYFDEQVSD